MRTRITVIATSLTILAGLVAAPVAGAQGGPGGGGGGVVTGGGGTGGGGTGGGGTGGGGTGGGGRPSTCGVVSVDPVTGTQFIVCSFGGRA